MASQKEIAQFFRLALRSGLTNTAAVERWVDSIIEADATVRFPFTELAGAARLPSGTVDELLGEVKGHCDLQLPGRVVLALIRRRFHEGALTPDAAIRLATEIAFAGPLTDGEQYTVDRLDDLLFLAASGTYGNLRKVRQEIAEFFENYAQFDQHISFLP